METLLILLVLVAAAIGGWWWWSRASRTGKPAPNPSASIPSNPWDRLAREARREAADPFSTPPVEMSLMVRGLSETGLEDLLQTYQGLLRQNLAALGLRESDLPQMMPDLRYRQDPNWVMRLDGLTAEQADRLLEQARQAGGTARVRTFYQREQGFLAGEDQSDLEMEFAVWTRGSGTKDLTPLSRLFGEFSRSNAAALGLDASDLSPGAGQPEIQDGVEVWQPLTWDQARRLYQEARRLGIPTAIRGLLPFPGD